MRLEGSYIIADYTEKTNTPKPKLEFSMEYDDDKNDLEKMVTLPHKERINEFAINYRACIDTSCHNLDLANFSPKVSFSGIMEGNKLHLQLSNPRQLTVYYQLYKDTKLILNEQSNQPGFLKTRAINPKKTYQLKYQFQWGEERINKEINFRPKYKDLAITIDQPTQIVPGETVPIKIKAKNYKGRKLKGVNLTAGAINKQFEQRTTHSELEFLTKRPKSLPYWKVNRYWAEAEIDELGKLKKTWKLNPDWLAKTNKEKKFYYQLRFPEYGAYLHYDTIQHPDTFYPVSYTHLTLPTIYSV